MARGEGRRGKAEMRKAETGNAGAGGQAQGMGEATASSPWAVTTDQWRQARGNAGCTKAMPRALEVITRTIFSGESSRNWPPAASGEIELPAGIRPAGEPVPPGRGATSSSIRWHVR